MNYYLIIPLLIVACYMAYAFYRYYQSLPDYLTEEEFLLDFLDYYTPDYWKRRSTDGMTCKYRMSDGRKCAIGRWIPEKLYSENMEGKTVDGTFPIESLADTPVKNVRNQVLTLAQDLHDSPDFWDRDKPALSYQGKYALADKLKKLGISQLPFAKYLTDL